MNWGQAAIWAAGGLAVGGVGAFAYSKMQGMPEARPGGAIRSSDQARLLIAIRPTLMEPRPLRAAGATAIENVVATGASQQANRWAAIGLGRQRAR